MFLSAFYTERVCLANDPSDWLDEASYTTTREPESGWNDKKKEKETAISLPTEEDEDRVFGR